MTPLLAYDVCRCHALRCPSSCVLAAQLTNAIGIIHQ